MHSVSYKFFEICDNFSVLLISPDNYVCLPLEPHRPVGKFNHLPTYRLPCWLRQQRIHLQCWWPRFNPQVVKVPWRRAWQPTPLFLPGGSPRTEEPHRLLSMGSQRVGHDWATKYTAHMPIPPAQPISEKGSTLRGWSKLRT